MAQPSYFPIRPYLAYALWILVLLVTMMPTYTHFDVHDFFFRWAEQIKTKGLASAYQIDCDYLPLYHYFLYLFGTFFPNVETMRADIMHLKHFTLPFHLLTGYFVACLLYAKQQDVYRVLYQTLFFVLNITLLYSVMIWGQIDSMVAAFMFLAVVYGLWEKPFLALFWTLLAVNTKLQAIIIIPIIALLCLYAFAQRRNWKHLVLGLLGLIATQVLILLPFILAGNLHDVWRVVFQSVGKYPFVSMNAFNVWELIFWDNHSPLSALEDNVEVFGYTYKQWGFHLFFTLSALVLAPLALKVLAAWTKESIAQLSVEFVLLASALICFLFFYVNTQMHERYPHPAFVFLIAYALLTNKFWITVPCCLAYILNLEAVITYFDFDSYGTLVFNKKFIASLYTLGISLLAFEYYKLVKRPDIEPN